MGRVIELVNLDGLTFADLEISARTVFGEARGEPFLGQIAVAHVLINRWQAQRMPRSHTLAATALRYKQFSAWNEGDPSREKMLAATLDDPRFIQALAAVMVALRDRLSAGTDPTEGSLHYHTSAVRPNWSVGHTPIAIIGAHQFFNDIA